MPGPAFTFLVNSCDAFEDTWFPFFELYRLNAKGLDTRELLLVTERKEYRHEGLKLRSSKANRNGNDRLTWSECLIDALEGIEGPLILYTQDDYFIEKPVDAATINAMAARMIADPSIGRIGLTHTGSSGPLSPTNDPEVWEVGPRAGYRITTQASLWRVNVLLSYLRPEENGWSFEIFGTRRSWRRQDRFLAVAPTLEEPIVYTLTGIIKGKWHRAMPALFARYDIPMDFNRRGFYDAPSPLLRKWQTFRTLLASPGKLFKGLRGL